jgi:hypothetical protein
MGKYASRDPKLLSELGIIDQDLINSIVSEIPTSIGGLQIADVKSDPDINSVIRDSHASGSDNQDLNGKVDKETGKGLSTNDYTTEEKQKLSGLGSGLGYIINVQALTSSPVDSQTVYFGMLPKAPITTANVSKIYIRKPGTIKIAEIYCYSGTAGTAESWSLYIRKNNSADTLIKTLTVNTNERVFTNSSLNISVLAGDYIEIKGVQPLWATNPATCIYGGYIYIE